MRLRLGFMHKKELAEFFHKKPSTIINHKEYFIKYCDILADYAVFEKVRGGVNIIEILDDEPYDEITFDLDRGIEEAIENAPDSKYVMGAKILTSSGILQYILDTQATKEEIEKFKNEKLFEKFQHRISYRLRKKKLLNEEFLEQYWSAIEEEKEIQMPAGRMMVPLLKEKKQRLLTSYQELTEQDKELIDKYVAEEEQNDKEHSKLAVYHLLDNAESYKDNEKEFIAEAKRLCKPFYRAMKRFNQERGLIYISKGTLVKRI